MKNNHDDFDGFTVNLFFDEDGDYCDPYTQREALNS